MSQPLPDRDRRLRRRPQARARATRQRILRAAEDRFGALGYEGASMTAIAARAGVGVGTLYHHFPDKHRLLLELIDDWGDRALTERRPERDADRFLGDDPRAAIQKSLRSDYERLRSEGDLWLVFLGLADRDAEVRRRFRRIERVSTHRMAELLEAGQRRGLVRREMDPLSAAFLIRRAVDMAATEVLVRESEELDPERVLEELTEMICRYILEERRL